MGNLEQVFVPKYSDSITQLQLIPGHRGQEKILEQGYLVLSER